MKDIQDHYTVNFGCKEHLETNKKFVIATIFFYNRWNFNILRQNGTGKYVRYNRFFVIAEFVKSKIYCSYIELVTPLDNCI